MATIFSIDNIVLTLNSHVVEGGFSEDADSIMTDPVELVGEPRIGADGTPAYFSSGNRGGAFTLKLLPNSPSIPFFQGEAERQRQGQGATWEGTIEDVAVGNTVQMRQGVLRTYPSFPSYGKGSVSNYEYVFYFAELASDYSTVDFSDSLITTLGPE